MIETEFTYMRNMLAKVEVIIKARLHLDYEQYMIGMYDCQAV